MNKKKVLKITNYKSEVIKGSSRTVLFFELLELHKYR